MPTRWKAVEGFAAHMFHSGELYVVYHDGSGDTHMLDEPSMAVLRFLSDKPASWEDLQAFVDERLDGAIESEDLQGMLQMLCRAGVIVRLDS
jgi:PqqD family protein of HPr-rel-A system